MTTINRTPNNAILQAARRAAETVQRRAAEVANRAQENIAKDPLKKAKQAVDTFTGARDSLKGARDNLRSVRQNGFRETLNKNWNSARNPAVRLDRANALRQGGKALGVVDGARRLGGQLSTASNDIRTAMRTGSAQDRDRAIGSTAAATKTTLSTAKAGVELARDARKTVGTVRAASRAFAQAAPNATRATQLRGTLGAARSALAGETQGSRAAQAARSAITQTAPQRSLSRAALNTAMGTGANPRVARQALNAATSAAGRAATQAAGRAAAGTLARAAGRFVPGANIGIAAADAATAYSTVRDPNASTTRKVTSVITALGSAAAATNIPVVSQVGAAISTISSFIGGLFG